MTKMAAAFVVKKIKEETKKRGEVEGIGEEPISNFLFVLLKKNLRS